jgi:hypothetical protein
LNFFLVDAQISNTLVNKITGRNKSNGMTFHAISPKQNWSCNYGQDWRYHTQDSRYHSTLATSTHLCEIINEFNKIHFDKLFWSLRVFWKNFSISENNILCVEVAKVLWYCKIKKAQSFHTRNPKQNSSLQLWSSYCNFIFHFPFQCEIGSFKGIEVHFVYTFFWDVKSKIILKATLSK